jgi:branched-chain amino acid aminotransferase
MDALFWHDGQWLTENPKLLGPADHAFWMASMVFDGARAFHGVIPDLELHCRRVVRSAEKMLMQPQLDAERIQQLCTEGVARFPAGSELYIKPMFYCADGFLLPDAAKTLFVLHIFKVPMPGDQGFTACFSSYLRSWSLMAPTDAKASCLYPNGQRAIKEALDKGFDNAVMCDGDGNVAEFATANLWLAKNGRVATPVDNGTFLNGITRQRVLKLLRDDGVTVEERSVTREDVLAADEVFSTGNYGKVVHVRNFEDRDLPYGPIARRAHALYMQWAHAQVSSPS